MRQSIHFHKVVTTVEFLISICVTKRSTARHVDPHVLSIRGGWSLNLGPPVSRFCLIVLFYKSYLKGRDQATNEMNDQSRRLSLFQCEAPCFALLR